MKKIITFNKWCCLLLWASFTSQSTIFQLCRDRSSWVEPELSRDKCILLKYTTQWHWWGSKRRPLTLESSTLPLSHCAPSEQENCFIYKWCCAVYNVSWKWKRFYNLGAWSLMLKKHKRHFINSYKCSQYRCSSMYVGESGFQYHCLSTTWMKAVSNIISFLSMWVKAVSNFIAFLSMLVKAVSKIIAFLPMLVKAVSNFIAFLSMWVKAVSNFLAFLAVWVKAEGFGIAKIVSFKNSKLKICSMPTKVWMVNCL